MLVQMYIPNKGGIYRSTYRKILLPSHERNDGTLLETQYTQYLR